MTTTELAVRDDQSQEMTFTGGGLALVQRPKILLEAAKEAAAALMEVVSSKPNPIMLGEKGRERQYLEFEDWQFIAAFYGVTVSTAWSRYISFTATRMVDGVLQETLVTGWEARADLKNRDGLVISSAEAMCCDDEPKWAARPNYVWAYELRDGSTSLEEPPKDQMVWVPNPDKPGKNKPKRTRVAAGTVAAPHFQVRSMAQTRSGVKALSEVFRPVALLGRFAGTPAEEMDIHVSIPPQDTSDHDDDRGTSAARQTTRTTSVSARKPEPAKTTTGGAASGPRPVPPTAASAVVPVPAPPHAPANQTPAGHVVTGPVSNEAVAVDTVTPVPGSGMSGVTKEGAAWQVWEATFKGQVRTTNGQFTNKARTTNDKLALALVEAGDNHQLVVPVIERHATRDAWILTAFTIATGAPALTPA